MGIVGLLSFTLLYLLRFTRPDPKPFDDLIVRVPSIIFMIALASQAHWLEHLRRYYIPTSYVAIWFSLPFFATFSGLLRGGGVAATVAGIFCTWFYARSRRTPYTPWAELRSRCLRSTPA